MQSETGFPSSHQLKSYVAFKSRLKLAARAVLSADAGLLVISCLLPVSSANVPQNLNAVARKLHNQVSTTFVRLSNDKFLIALMAAVNVLIAC